MRICKHKAIMLLARVNNKHWYHYNVSLWNTILALLKSTHSFFIRRIHTVTYTACHFNTGLCTFTKQHDHRSHVVQAAQRETLLVHLVASGSHCLVLDHLQLTYMYICKKTQKTKEQILCAQTSQQFGCSWRPRCRHMQGTEIRPAIQTNKYATAAAVFAHERLLLPLDFVR